MYIINEDEKEQEKRYISFTVIFLTEIEMACKPLQHYCCDESFTAFYYTHFEITGGPCNLISSNWCDLFTNRTIFCFKSNLVLSQ